jgi:hypothetical protein
MRPVAQTGHAASELPLPSEGFARFKIRQIIANPDASKAGDLTIRDGATVKVPATAGGWTASRDGLNENS